MSEDKPVRGEGAGAEPGGSGAPARVEITGRRRLFLGARLAVGVSNALAAAVETLRRRAREAGHDVRWVAPAGYHVTLKFLGWTREDAVGAIGDAAAAAAAGTPRLAWKTGRLGAFPSLEKASVLWAGVEDGGALGALAGKLDAACAALGFARETRPFHAHVTVGRLRQTRALRELVLPMAEQMFGDTRIDAITLFESETKPTGSVYRELRKISLEAALPGGFSASERQRATLELGAPTTSGEPDTDDGWPRGQGPNHDL